LEKKEKTKSKNHAEGRSPWGGGFLTSQGKREGEHREIGGIDKKKRKTKGGSC